MLFPGLFDRMSKNQIRYFYYKDEEKDLHMKQENKNKGFTLVEMIVVIVIIGILLAILVPGLFKYIKKAKDQQALIECRAVVTAAQAEALELSGKNKFIPYEFTTPNFLTKICSEAGVTGSVTYGINFSESPDTEISYLEYKTKGDIIVAYDINTNVLYYIKESINLSDMNNRLHNYGESFDKDFGTNYKKWNDARDKYFNTDEALLTQNEIKLLTERTTLTEEKLGSLRWLPCRYQNEDSTYEHYFVATDKSGQFNVSLVYYNGAYYYFQGNNGKTGASSMTNANASTIEKLKEAASNADDLSNVKDKWIRIDK